MIDLYKALEEIRDKAKSWEGRKDTPYWNLGDIAAAALKKYHEPYICEICGGEVDYIVCQECSDATRHNSPLRRLD